MARITSKSTDLVKAWAKLTVKVEAAAAEGIKDFENNVKPDIDRATPEDTGQLLKSYKVTDTSSNAEPNVVKYQLSFGPVYGDNGENYAALVHEWPQNKNWTKPGSGPKFLERPVYSRARELIPAVMAAFKKITRI